MLYTSQPIMTDATTSELAESWEEQDEPENDLLRYPQRASGSGFDGANIRRSTIKAATSIAGRDIVKRKSQNGGAKVNTFINIFANAQQSSHNQESDACLAAPSLRTRSENQYSKVPSPAPAMNLVDSPTPIHKTRPDSDVLTNQILRLQNRLDLQIVATDNLKAQLDALKIEKDKQDRMNKIELNKARVERNEERENTRRRLESKDNLLKARDLEYKEAEETLTRQLKQSRDEVAQLVKELDQLQTELKTHNLDRDYEWAARRESEHQKKTQRVQNATSRHSINKEAIREKKKDMKELKKAQDQLRMHVEEAKTAYEKSRRSKGQDLNNLHNAKQGLLELQQKQLQVQTSVDEVNQELSRLYWEKDSIEIEKNNAITELEHDEILTTSYVEQRPDSGYGSRRTSGLSRISVNSNQFLQSDTTDVASEMANNHATPLPAPITSFQSESRDRQLMPHDAAFELNEQREVGQRRLANVPCATSCDPPMQAALPPAHTDNSSSPANHSTKDVPARTVAKTLASISELSNASVETPPSPIYIPVHSRHRQQFQSHRPAKSIS